MTSLRLLAFASGAIGLAVAGAGLLPAKQTSAPVVRAAAPPPSPITSTTTSSPRSAATAATVGPAKPAPDLRDVPPSILSRAAAARALDRAAGTACRSTARSDTSCAPQRDSVEIHWDVGKDP